MLRTARRTDFAAGSLVALITAPTLVGAAVGGWLAARQTSGPRSGAIAGGAAGVLGAVPWAILVAAASAGAIGRLGYRGEFLRVGLEPVEAAAIGPWQAIGIAAVAALTLCLPALVGGSVAGSTGSGSGEIDLGSTRENGSS